MQIGGILRENELPQSKPDGFAERTPTLSGSLRSPAVPLSGFTIFPRPGEVVPCRGSFLPSANKWSKTSPFRGRWHRAAMTERVLSVPPALFLSSLALFVTCGDIFPRPGRICPGAGEVCQRERPWQRDEVCVDCQRLSLWESCQGR